MSQIISVLLPTFNGSKYITEQIKSILGQSYSDFELLTCDDGSTDGTVDILRAFEARDRRITVVSGCDNQGQNRRLFSLLARARGSLVAFADQDDIWDRAKLALLQAKLATSSFGLAFGSSHLINSSGNRLGQTLHEVAQLQIHPEDALRIIFLPLVSGHAMLTRRKLIWDGVFGSPVLFDWLISLDAQFAGGLVFEEAAITYHRIHDTNQANGNLAAGLADDHFAPNVTFPRIALSSGQDDRIRFYQRIRHLAGSPVIPRSLQLTFARVALECQNAWFSSFGRRARGAVSCRNLLLASLLPLASTQRDAQHARANILALCSNFRKRRFLDTMR